MPINQPASLAGDEIDQRLREIRRLREAVTQAPWATCRWPNGQSAMPPELAGGFVAKTGGGDGEMYVVPPTTVLWRPNGAERDARFIAAAPGIVDELLALVDQLRASRSPSVQTETEAAGLIHSIEAVAQAARWYAENDIQNHDDAVRLQRDCDTAEAFAASLRASSPASRSSEPAGDEPTEADDVALVILCRVFDDGADEGFTEWQEWYKPSEWLRYERALGAFIRNRLLAKREFTADERVALAALEEAMDHPTRDETGTRVTIAMETRTPEPTYHDICRCGREFDIPLSWSNTTCGNCGRTYPGQFQAREWSDEDLRRALQSLRSAVVLTGPLSDDPQFSQETHDEMHALIQAMSVAFPSTPAEPAGPSGSTCNTCKEALNAAGYCTNKQCSRHGRRNDYLDGASGTKRRAETAIRSRRAAHEGDDVRRLGKGDAGSARRARAIRGASSPTPCHAANRVRPRLPILACVSRRAANTGDDMRNASAVA